MKNNIVFKTYLLNAKQASQLGSIVTARGRFNSFFALTRVYGMMAAIQTSLNLHTHNISALLVGDNLIIFERGSTNTKLLQRLGETPNSGSVVIHAKVRD